MTPKTQFATREGTYKLMNLSEYTRPNRTAYNGQGNTPVKVSFITLSDHVVGAGERICFNIGRELYVYAYNGVRKVGIDYRRCVVIALECFIVGYVNILELPCLIQLWHRHPTRPCQTDQSC